MPLKTKSPTPYRLVRLPEVLEMTGIGHRTTVWVYIKEGRFPRPKRIGRRAMAWRQGDVEAWMDSLPDAGPQPEERGNEGA